MVQKKQPDTVIRRAGASRHDEAIALAQAGAKDRAREIFRRIIHATPEDEDAWLWLAWLAESKDEAWRYLTEGHAFLPDSQRIAQAMRWARGEPVGDAPAVGGQAREGAGESAGPGAVADTVAVRDRVESVARTVHQETAESLERLRIALQSVKKPQVPWQRVKLVLVPIVYTLVLSIVFFLVLLGISSARSKRVDVQALDLPPPAPDVTATLSVAQQTESLWVQVEVALTRQDWRAAIVALERIREIDPRNEKARTLLAAALYERGWKSVSAGKLEPAHADFDQAVRLDAGNADLQRARSLLRTYLDGVNAYWASDWPTVIGNLQKVYEANPDFKDARVMLAQAHVQLGKQLEAQELWTDALPHFAIVVDELMPDMTEARAHLDQVRKAITPPNRIEVDLSAQTVTIVQDDQPFKVFPTCTGRASAPTLPGRYEVQTKLPMAYASKWNIDMPWWLGIYYAGGTENGFHALPMTKQGAVLWRDHLGVPCSYGCIVLSTEQAKFLYDWASIGTVVFVKP